MYNILIWGTGEIAQKILIDMEQDWNIIGYIESEPTNKYYREKPIMSPDSLPKDYDYLIVANTYTDEVHETCKEMGIDESRMIYLCTSRKQLGCSDMKRIRDVLGEKHYAFYCEEFKIYDKSYVYEDARRYDSQNHRDSFKIYKKDMNPVLVDKYKEAGSLNNYFWQDLWAAKLIHKSGVKEHYDIGSRLDGFIAHLLAMSIEVTMIDIRDFPGNVEHLHTIQADATNLEGIEDGSIESLSALCSL